VQPTAVQKTKGQPLGQPMDRPTKQSLDQPIHRLTQRLTFGLLHSCRLHSSERNGKLSNSFQMSFAATLALIAGYERGAINAGGAVGRHRMINGVIWVWRTPSRG